MGQLFYHRHSLTQRSSSQSGEQIVPASAFVWFDLLITYLISLFFFCPLALRVKFFLVWKRLLDYSVVLYMPRGAHRKQSRSGMNSFMRWNSNRFFCAVQFEQKLCSSCLRWTEFASDDSGETITFQFLWNHMKLFTTNQPATTSWTLFLSIFLILKISARVCLRLNGGVWKRMLILQAEKRKKGATIIMEILFAWEQLRQ